MHVPVQQPTYCCICQWSHHIIASRAIPLGAFLSPSHVLRTHDSRNTPSKSSVTVLLEDSMLFSFPSGHVVFAPVVLIIVGLGLYSACSPSRVD